MSNAQDRIIRRKRRKGVAIAAAVIAFASPVILIGVANAQTAPDLLADCLANSSALQECNYIEVSGTPDTLGTPERVSTILDNCTSTVAANKSFEWTVTVARSIETEKGRTGALGGLAEGSVAGVAQKHTGGTLTIAGGAEEHTGGNKISGNVNPARQGFIMFQRKSFASVGYLHGVYADAINGQKEFDYPAPQGDGVKVFFPQLLQGGLPDGRVWLRNAPCGVSVQSDNDLQTAGFGEIPGVEDVELTL